MLPTDLICRGISVKTETKGGMKQVPSTVYLSTVYLYYKAPCKAARATRCAFRTFWYDTQFIHEVSGDPVAYALESREVRRSRAVKSRSVYFLFNILRYFKFEAGSLKTKCGYLGVQGSVHRPDHFRLSIVSVGRGIHFYIILCSTKIA